MTYIKLALCNSQSQSLLDVDVGDPIRVVVTGVMVTVGTSVASTRGN